MGNGNGELGIGAGGAGRRGRGLIFPICPLHPAPLPLFHTPYPIMLVLVQEFPGEDIRGSDRTMLLPVADNLGLLRRNLEKAGDR